MRSPDGRLCLELRHLAGRQLASCLLYRWPMLRGRGGVALGMILIAVVALKALHLLGTAWSNNCDPGNAQINLLKSDPIVSSLFKRAHFMCEIDGSDIRLL